MAMLTWDETGKRLYETGVDRGVLYTTNETGEYDVAHAWNGLVSVSESPDGGESNPQYADNIKYLNLTSAENFNCTIEAYTYPRAFGLCDGTEELTAGVTIGQQARRSFGLAYRTIVGNDVQENAYGYKLHLVYGGRAKPTSKDYSTVNDSPEAITFSWEVNTTPVAVEGHKPTATLTIDSTSVGEAAMAAVEAVLYGSDTETGRLPLPDEVATIVEGAAV